MEYEINIKNNMFFFPRTERWIMDTFDLDTVESLLYQIILSKNFMTWTPQWLGTIMKLSESTVKRMLNRMVEREIIAKRTFNLYGSARQRTVYVALYTIEGKRSAQEVSRLFYLGKTKIEQDYSERRFYKKG